MDKHQHTSEYKLLQTSKERLNRLLAMDAPKSIIENERRILAERQARYDKIKNKLILHLSDQEEKRLIRRFNTAMDKVVQEQELMRYNVPQNDFQGVYSVLKDIAEIAFAPSDPNDVETLTDFILGYDVIPELLTMYIKDRYTNIK